LDRSSSMLIQCSRQTIVISLTFWEWYWATSLANPLLDQMMKKREIERWPQCSDRSANGFYCSWRTLLLYIRLDWMTKKLSKGPYPAKPLSGYSVVTTCWNLAILPLCVCHLRTLVYFLTYQSVITILVLILIIIHSHWVVLIMHG
jgi:hypothetical protein